MANSKNGPATFPQAKRFFDSPVQLLEKMRWEIEELRKTVIATPTSSFEMAALYHAHNCAITAWQMTDWIWGKYREQLQCGAAKGFPMCTKLINLQEVVRDQCGWLDVCHQLATGSKHWIIERIDSDPTVVVKSGFISHAARAGELRAGEPLAKIVFVPGVQFSGAEWDADIVFQGAYDYWRDRLADLD